MPGNRQIRFFLLLIACAVLGLLDASIRSAGPALQLIEPAASVVAFALIIAVGFKALPGSPGELPLRRVAIILIGAVLVAVALFSVLTMLPAHSGEAWYQSAPLILAFAALAFILYRNFVVRRGKKP